MKAVLLQGVRSWQQLPRRAGGSLWRGCRRALETSSHSGLRVAIVGRPNVGKSTLFNRLTGGKGRWSGGAALVTPIPGTTRDRKEGRCEMGGYPMVITDTGGYDPDVKEAEGARGGGGFQALINAQAEEAIRGADAVIFVLDAREGLSPEDELFARRLQKLVSRILHVSS
jgi:GTPase